ncbi:MAG: hypothetical protein KDA61_13315 [Planctomycetales bacterium]|nr:hypothetical protein [Planctomycetales bacterium]
MSTLRIRVYPALWFTLIVAAATVWSYRTLAEETTAERGGAFSGQPSDGFGFGLREGSLGGGAFGGAEMGMRGEEPAGSSGRDSASTQAEQRSQRMGAIARGVRAADPIRAAAIERIERTLDQTLVERLEFTQAPLSEVLMVISDQFSLSIVFDRAALEAVAISPECEVDVNLSAISLRSTLELLLRQVEGLTFIVDQEVLLITTEEVAQQRLTVRLYDLAELLNGDSQLRREDVEQLITSVVEHDSWACNQTGLGRLVMLPSDVMVASATEAVHREIANLLASLMSLRD